MLNRKYEIIYADPPWKYRQTRLPGAAEKHYPCMTIDELCMLPVSTLAAENCVLFLWTTYPQLQDAFKVIKAWGFEYKTTAFVWIKQNKRGNGFFLGLGFWTRGNSEICLLATKGHPHRICNNIRQLVFSPVEAHSKKPDIVRNRIVALMGDLPRIELFARDKAPGWDCWGNEVDSNITFP